MRKLAPLVSVFLLARCACPTPEPPPLRGVEVGTIIGEAFVEDGAGRVSVGGAVVRVAGLGVEETTIAGSKFVLESIPVGAHDITIEHAELGRAVRFQATIKTAFQTVVLDDSLTTLARAARVRGQVVVDNPIDVDVFLIGGDASDVARPGDDGTFVIEGVPPGAAQIAFAKPGFDLAVLEVALAEGDNDLEAVTLSPSAVGDLPLAGSAQIVDGVDHRGIAIRLNDGEAVTTSEQSGAFAFAALSPGRYRLTASKPGFRTASLPTVALAANGNVFGLVPIFLQPGEDPPPVVAAETRVEVVAPTSGAALLSGATTAFDAVVDNGDASLLTWTVSVDGAAPTAVGSGTPVIVTVPNVSARSQLDVVARLPDGTSDSVAVFVDPIVIPPPVVTIIAPGPGDVLVGGTSAVLDADVENGDAAQLTWALRVFGDTAEIDLGSGTPVVAPMPETVARESYEILARLPDGTVDSVVVFVDPSVISAADPFVPGADALVAGVVATELVDQDGVIIGSRYVIQEGQPITIEPSPGLSAVFTDGNQAFANALPLRDLPVGTHTFTATFTTDGGQQGTSVVEIEVQPLTFTVTVSEPTADGAFFDDTPIPLRAQIAHGFQTGFLADAVSWRDQNGAVIGNGAIDSATLAAGPTVITVEVVDVIGNIRNVVVPIDVVTLSFNAFFSAPANGSSVLEGTPLRVNVGFNHNRLSPDEQAAVVVHLISDRAGRLSDDGGANEFAPGTDIFVSSLVEGTHVITARVFAGGRIATATSTIRVEVPFVSSLLLSNSDLLAVPGQPLVVEVAASGGNGAVPLVHWFLDGVELDAAWAGYGADPADPGRQRMDFGVYDPNAFPFTDPRWFEGPHTVEAWVRAAEVDFNLGCTDQGVRAQCHSINLDVARAPIVITSNLNLTNPATPEVWSGVVQLQAEVLLNGGKLVILPGTQVLIDMRSVANPTVAVTAAEREIVVQGGTLEIGVENGAEVLFETIKSFASTPRWNGIHQGTANGNERSFVAHNTTVRDTVLGLTFDNVDLVSGTRQLVLDGVTVENSTQGIRVECATTLQDIRLRNIGSGGAAALQLQHAAFCPSTERIDGLFIEGAQNGVQLFPASSPTITTISGADVQGTITRGVLAQANVHVVIEDSRLSGNTNGGSTVAALHLDAGGSGEVHGSVFDNNVNSVSIDDPGVLGFTASGTRFANTARAIHVHGIATGRPVEVHASTFENAGLILEWQNTGTNFVDEAHLEGNFLGEPTQVGSAALTLAQTPPGVFPNVPRVTDARDSLGSQVLGTTRIDNPLPTTAIPHAVIVEPKHMHAYNGATQCIPAVAHPRDRGFDAVASCGWRVGPPGGAAADATAIQPDSSGCLAGLPDGEHTVHLVCNDGATETVHSTRLLVDSTRYAGRIHPNGETWSGTVVVDGDVIIPGGTTLTIEPGTTVRFKDTDRSFYWRPFSFSNVVNNLKLRGSPTKVDFHVDGTIDVLGEPGSPVAFEAESGVAPGRWGGILLGSGNPTVRLHHTTARGADSLLASTSDFAPANSPVYDIVELNVEDSTFVFTGLCPNVIANLDTLRNVAIADCGASAGITFDGGNWLETRGGNVTAWVHVITQTGGALIQPTIQNVVGTGVSTSREVFFAPDSGSTPDSNVFDVDVTEVSTLVSQVGGAQRTFIDGTLLRNFNLAVTGNGNADFVITHSAFEDGDRILNANIQVFTLDGSRVTRVPRVLEVLPRGFQVMSITNSRIEGALHVIDFNQTSGGAGPATMSFTGNNFLGTANRVFLLRGAQLATLTTSIDMTNNHWGAADRDTILTLIEDPRTDADLNDDIEGRTSFANSSATPLVLTTP